MRRVTHSGIDIAYETIGEGPPLMLLHGLSGSSRTWHDAGYLEPLVAAGYRVILSDARGHGHSAKPHQPALYSEAARCADVIAVLDDLEIERAALLGYSMGGRTALALACHHPKRVAAVVAGGAPAGPQSMRIYRDVFDAGLETWLGLLERQYGGPLPLATRTRIAANDIEALRAVVAEDRPSLLDELTAKGVPLMLYSGAADPLCKQIAEDADALRAGFFEIPGASHLQAALAGAPVVRETLAFLAGSATEDGRTGACSKPGGAARRRTRHPAAGCARAGRSA